MEPTAELTFRTYQSEAQLTDQAPIRSGDSDVDMQRALFLPLLGLEGEVGSLVTEYKKQLREGSAYTVFKERLEEEIGDVLWYLTNLVAKADLDLAAIASKNIDKTRNRWKWRDADTNQPLLDEGSPSDQQFPRHFVVDMFEVTDSEKAKVFVYVDGKKFGDELTDNAHDDDGYRFHDVFHFACAAVLGWSPITRRLLNRKRKHDPKLDEVEDGARSAIIEEAISALAFDYAKDHSFLEGVDSIEYDLLARLHSLTVDRESANLPLSLWERMLMQAFAVWRQIRATGGGRFECDLVSRQIRYLGPANVAS